MFTVNRQEIFVAIPVSRIDLDISLCIEGGAVTFEVYSTTDVVDYVNKSLTAQEVSDMIDALEEVKRRLKGEKK